MNILLSDVTTETAPGVGSSEIVGRQCRWPRRCVIQRTTDGYEYISEFDDYSTAAVRTTVKTPDGREYSW